MKSPYLIDILFMNDKPKRGGARPGAGAKKKKPTVVKTYRCYPEEVPAIKESIKKTINKMRTLTTMLLFAPLLSWAQVKPTASFGVGFNNSAPLHGFIETGAEINNVFGLFADYKITYGLNTWHAVGAKGGLILPIGQGDDEYLMLHVGAQYFSFPPKYELDSKVKPAIGFRWQYYNVTTDFTYSGGFGFITLAWQFKRLECFK